MPEQPIPLSVIPSPVIPPFSNTIGNTGPQFSTTVNTSAQIPDDVFESYRLAQAKMAPYLNKMNLVNSAPQQPNNYNWVEFNKFKEDLASVVKSKLGVDLGNSNLYQKSYDAEFDKFLLPHGW